MLQASYRVHTRNDQNNISRAKGLPAPAFECQLQNPAWQPMNAVRIFRDTRHISDNAPVAQWLLQHSQNEALARADAAHLLLLTPPSLHDCQT